MFRCSRNDGSIQLQHAQIIGAAGLAEGNAGDHHHSILRLGVFGRQRGFLGLSDHLFIGMQLVGLHRMGAPQQA